MSSLSTPKDIAILFPFVVLIFFLQFLSFLFSLSLSFSVASATTTTTTTTLYRWHVHLYRYNLYHGTNITYRNPHFIFLFQFSFFHFFIFPPIFLFLLTILKISGGNSRRLSISHLLKSPTSSSVTYRVLALPLFGKCKFGKH